MEPGADFIKTLLKAILFLGLPSIALSASSNGVGGSFINNQNTLQGNATFYVSSGTVTNINTTNLKFNDGTIQTTAGSGGGSGSSNINIQKDGASVVTTSTINFVGNQFLPASVSSKALIDLNPGTTFFIRNSNVLQSGSMFYVSSGTVNGQFVVQKGNPLLRVELLPSTTQMLRVVNVSSQTAFIQFISSGSNGWRVGNDVTNLNSPQFAIFDETTSVKVVTISTGDVVTFNSSNINIPGLTASQPVKTDASKNLVSGLINVTSDITGTVPSTNLPSNVLYTNVQQTISGSNVFTATETFNTFVGIPYVASNNCLQTDSQGRIVGTGSSCGSGGGGITPGATFYIQNANTLQSGSTAYPDFLVVGTGQILGKGGSASSPTFSFSSVTTTGWFSSAGPGIHGSIAGTDVIGILSSGLFPSGDLASQLGGAGNRWTNTYSNNFHSGYGTTAAPSYSIGLSSNGFYADSDITFKAVVQKGYAAGGSEFTFGTGGLQIQADNALNALAVTGINNNDMGILIKNNSTGTSAVSVLSAQEANNQDAVSLAVFGENYGIPGGHRLGVLPPNNITVLESGGTASNGFVIDTILNQPIWFGVNSTLVETLSTGTFAATFVGSVSASSGSFSGGVNSTTGTFSGLLTASSASITNSIKASSVTITGMLSASSTTIQGPINNISANNDTTDPPLAIKTKFTREADNLFHSAILYGKIPNGPGNEGEFIITVSTNDLPSDPGTTTDFKRPEIALQYGDNLGNGQPTIGLRSHSVQFPNSNPFADFVVAPGTVAVTSGNIFQSGDSTFINLTNSLLATNSAGLIISTTGAGASGLIHNQSTLQPGSSFYVALGSATTMFTSSITVASLLTSVKGTFTGPLTLSAGSVSATAWNLGDSGTGDYRTGSNQIGIALNGIQAADFFTTGTGDNLAYAPFLLYGGGGSNTAFEFITQSTTGVTSAGKDILYMDINAYDCMVAGADGGGNDFNDKVLVGYYNSGGSPSVTSYTTRGSPAARTYAHDGDGSMKLTVGSGTYNVRVSCHGMTTR